MMVSRRKHCYHKIKTNFDQSIGEDGLVLNIQGGFSRRQAVQRPCLLWTCRFKCPLQALYSSAAVDRVTWQSGERRDLARDWLLLPGRALQSPEPRKLCLFPSAHPNQLGMEVIMRDRGKAWGRDEGGNVKQRHKGEGREIRSEKQVDNCFLNF